jgi:hypothetical protein
MTPLARSCVHVLFQPVAEGGVLLDTRSETYFGLNAVGARVCELLPRHSSLESLCAELGREYAGVPTETLRTDVTELLDELVGLGLLEMPGSHENGGRRVAPPSA